MKKILFFLFLLAVTKSYSQHPDLENILQSNDLSYLVHNNVATHNPMPHGWEKFSHAQSPLGRFTFPLVMAMHTGDVYSLQNKGEIIQQTTISQQWLPWLFQSQNDQIKVRRTIGKDICMYEVTSINAKNIVVLEMNSFTDHYYRNPNDIKLKFNKDKNQFTFSWKDYTVLVTFKGITDLMMCQDVQPMLRKFQGFDDVVIVDESVTGCWKRNGVTFLGAAFNNKLTITMEVIKNNQPSRSPEFDNLVVAEKQYWTVFFNRQVPLLKTNNKVIIETYYHAWVTFWSNRFDGGGGLTPYPYIASSAFMYPIQFFWDEFYHSILLSNLKDPELPYQFFKNYAFAQAPDGGMPGGLNHITDEERYRKEVTEKGSGDMQPILLGVTLQYLKEKPGWPKDKTDSIYNTYNRYVNWLYKNKDIDGNGLVEYTNSYNSGADNSPRFDNLYSEGNHIGNMQAVEGVEQNVWLSLMHHDLSEMAQMLGDSDASKQHAQKAAQLEEKIENSFWNEADGFYYDINVITHKQIKVKTEFGFMAMFLKNSHKDRIKRLVNEHLLNPKEFWCNYPVPSVACNEPTFDKEDMWRGPVWPNVNWLICLALEKQGYKDIARQLALKTVLMVGPQYDGQKCTRGPRFNEWFNPETGQALGNENISWTCTVADLILRYLNE
jgi:hypothetical protein